MSEDWQAGDLAVCVSDDDDPRANRRVEWGPKHGRAYRVEYAAMTCVGVFGIMLTEQPDKTGCYAADRFRKLRAADEQFIRKIKACQPIRQPLKETV